MKAAVLTPLRVLCAALALVVAGCLGILADARRSSDDDVPDVPRNNAVAFPAGCSPPAGPGSTTG